MPGRRARLLKHRSSIVGLMLVSALCANAARMAAAAATVWVGPGDATGDGSRDKPFAFRQGLSGEAGTAARIEPGTTVRLLAGTYRPDWPNTTDVTKASTPHVFHVGLKGTADEPITIEPEPGAAVHLDGCLEVNGTHLLIVGLEIGRTVWR